VWRTESTRLPKQYHLHGAGFANSPSEPLSAATARHEAILDLGKRKRGGGARIDNVTSHCKLQARSQAGTIYRCNDRLPDLKKAAPVPKQSLTQCLHRVLIKQLFRVLMKQFDAEPA
jgi:hypothetical protein